MTTQATIPDFELKVGGLNGIDNADVPVRWCLTTALQDQLKADGVHDPHILLISYNPKKMKEISRHIVPMAQLMTYVRFTSAGDMVLHGWIINGNIISRKDLKRRYLAKDGSCYDSDLFNDTGTNGDPWVDHFEEMYKHTWRMVTIPDNVFAKEPNPKMKWFVNKWFEGKLRDRCHYRQRFWISVLIKWEFMLLWMVIITAFRLLLLTLVELIGCHHFIQSYKPLIHPWDMTTEMLFHEELEFELGYAIKTENRTFFTFVGFTPIIPLLISIVTFLANGWPEGGGDLVVIMTAILAIGVIADVFISLIDVVEKMLRSHTIQKKWNQLDQYLTKKDRWPETILGTVGVLAVLVLWAVIAWWKAIVLIGVALVLFYLFGYLVYKFWAFTLGLFTIEEDYNEVDNIRELLCPADHDNLIASLKYVPAKQRSGSLLFGWLKNSMCKPMQE